MSIQGELPEFFNKQIFFYIFEISYYIYMPLAFLMEKLYSFADNFGEDISVYLIWVELLMIPVYTYTLVCILNSFGYAIKTVRKKGHMMPKRWLTAAAFFISTLFLISWFVIKEIYRPGPVFFALDEESAQYTIKKYIDGSSSNYFVVYKPPVGKEAEISEILVGKSKIDLDKYVRKNLRIIGSYSGRFDDIQCIRDNCHRIGKSLVIDIDKIEEIGGEIDIPGE
jgi:hypothetical protein